MSSAKAVYIVDDERVIAETLAIILRQQGFETTAFYSAEQALLAVKEKQPDLVISDVVMHGMTGIDLLLELRRTHADVRCILLSGQAQTSILLEEARREGHDIAVLTKPIHPTDLLAHVRSAF